MKLEERLKSDPVVDDWLEKKVDAVESGEEFGLDKPPGKVKNKKKKVSICTSRSAP